MMKNVNRKPNAFSPFFFLIFLLIGCQSGNQIVLTNNGVSDYEIVVADNSQETVKQAAEELQKAIEKISEITIPIVENNSQTEEKKKILLDGSHWATAEQVGIKTSGDTLFILGGSPDALYNATLVFLEDFLACRWYAPGVDKFPQQKTIRLVGPIDYQYTPGITTRTVHSRLFYEHPEFAAHQKVTTEAFPRYVPEARVHTFHRMLPEQVFYKKHPEYYALREGRRLPTQLCLSNPAVLQIVKDSVQAMFARHPEASVLSVSQDDNTQYCQCDNCRKIDEEEGSPAASMIRFVNAVAADFPDKMISTLAYQYTRKPCKTKPAENVLITLCSIECDRSAPIAEECTDFAADLMGWKQLTENIRIWDYTTQFTNFLAPFPNLHTLQPNLQFFRDNHAKWVFEQHSHNPSELFELRSYLTAKLLWNPDADADAIITDFVNGYYDEAGPSVKKYIDDIHRELQNDSTFFLYLYGDPSQAFSSFLKPELLVQYNACFDEAEAAVAAKPDVLQRVKTARLGVDYASLEAARKNSFDQFRLTNISNGKKQVDTTSLQRLKNFEEICRKADIHLMNEMGYTVDEYCRTFEKTAQRMQMNNVAEGKIVTLLSKSKKYANEDPQTLTDGALGGSSFFANWLGFEGNDLEGVIDLETIQPIDTVAVSFLQVTNHIVFFPEKVTFSYSTDNSKYQLLGEVKNQRPLSRESKVNDMQEFNLYTQPVQARYLKIQAKNTGIAPVWHHAAGLPVWIFCDEVMAH